MRNTGKYNGCFAVMGTLTNAQKAQNALAAAAIPTGISKSNGSASHRGCVWSIGFSCNQTANVKSVLSSAGIPVRSWVGGNDIL